MVGSPSAVPHDGIDRGYFVAPTVFADVEPDHRIFQEEIFGPVISITPYDGGDDGLVEMANNSAYGVLGSARRWATPTSARSRRAADTDRTVKHPMAPVLRGRRTVRRVSR